MVEPAGWPDGYDRRILEEVDSTNAEALRVAGTLERPVWIMARHQRAARGRRGRPWHQSTGNFAGTLMLLCPDPPADLARRSFVAALALRDALGSLTGAGALLALKWPNDVLLDTGKVAGILLETASGGIAIGLGVNLNGAPATADLDAGALPPVSVLDATGHRIAPETLLLALARAYAVRETQLHRDGFGSIRADWLAAAARLGDMVTARMGRSELRGRYIGVDESGALVLETDIGRRAISAAEIFFG